jgi:hypothetical protein
MSQKPVIELLKGNSLGLDLRKELREIEREIYEAFFVPRRLLMPRTVVIRTCILANTAPGERVRFPATNVVLRRCQDPLLSIVPLNPDYPYSIPCVDENDWKITLVKETAQVEVIEEQ